MRIRSYRAGDIPTLVYIQQEAARADGLELQDEAAFHTLLDQPELHGGYYAFLITDDDEQNTWGQGESLDGLEGEVVGYTILQLQQNEQGAYRFHSHGAVLPEHRQRGGGYSLLLCALNHSRLKAIDLSNHTNTQGQPVYFEVLLPASDPTTARLADLFDLEETAEAAPTGLRLYQTQL